MGRTKRKCVYPSRVNDRIACPPTHRLMDLLRLGNNPTIFRILKQHMYRIAEKHLALEYAINNQEEEWVAVEAELVETLPDIFEGSDALELACHMIKSYHYRRRFASKHQIQSAPLSSRKGNLVMSVTVPTRAALKKEREREAAMKQKENNIIDFTLDGKAEHVEKPKNKIEIVEPKLPPMMDISNRLPEPATIKRASRSTSPVKFNPSQQPSALGSSAARLNSQNTPLHAESSSQARSSNNNVSFKQDNHEDAFKLTGITRVARFLNACSPPMAHFLQPFINFGCTGEEYLVAVSTWPPEKISHFLRQVASRGNDKREFTPMDMLILQNHFISYFNKAQT